MPPLSVLKRTGCDHHLLINIILTCFGWTPGILHAWYIILRLPDGKRAAKMIEDVGRRHTAVYQLEYGSSACGEGAHCYTSHHETQYHC
jgi:uncharacterized membrane protein YqaE (UPF0057 family)